MAPASFPRHDMSWKMKGNVLEGLQNALNPVSHFIWKIGKYFYEEQNVKLRAELNVLNLKTTAMKNRKLNFERSWMILIWRSQL